MTVGQWKRRGKYLMAALEPEGGVWGVHLRMTGQFQWHEQPSEPCKHTRVRFWNSKEHELRFVDVRSFGEMWWVPPGQPMEEVITGLTRLGPEPFSTDFSASYLKQKLKAAADRSKQRCWIKPWWLERETSTRMNPFSHQASPLSRPQGSWSSNN